MTQDWNVEYQLVPPDMHRRNAAERVIRTFKAHFISIMAGFACNLPSHLWDVILPMADLTLNLLREAANNQELSAWSYFNSTFNYDSSPQDPLGCKVMIHKTRGVTLVGLSWKIRLLCWHVTWTLKVPKGSRSKHPCRPSLWYCRISPLVYDPTHAHAWRPYPPWDHSSYKGPGG